MSQLPSLSSNHNHCSDLPIDSSTCTIRSSSDHCTGAFFSNSSVAQECLVCFPCSHNHHSWIGHNSWNAGNRMKWTYYCSWCWPCEYGSTNFSRTCHFGTDVVNYLPSSFLTTGNIYPVSSVSANNDWPSYLLEEISWNCDSNNYQCPDHRTQDTIFYLPNSNSSSLRADHMFATIRVTISAISGYSFNRNHWVVTTQPCASYNTNSHYFCHWVLCFSFLDSSHSDCPSTASMYETYTSCFCSVS